MLRASQQINGGSGINTLDLEGGGIFNLAAPSVLENIQVVNATEGAGTAEPFIFLRNGLNVTLNLLDPVAAAVVHGATTTTSSISDRAATPSMSAAARRLMAGAAPTGSI